jgi:hypothetical protein
MSDHEVDISMGAEDDAATLIARAAAAETRAHRTLAVAIDDFFLAEDARLDERTRSALAALLRALVATVEAEVREHGARLLADQGEDALAAALTSGGTPVLARLRKAGLLHDPELMAELIARVRQDAIGGALPMLAPDDPERPSLINRFVQHPDRVLATGAMGVLIAESRRRGSAEGAPLLQTDLPAELHHRLVWWVAAALRARAARAGQGLGAILDRALCDAAERSLAAYDEGDRLEAAALRFAAAIDAHPDELPDFLVESLGDGRLVLFTALLAHGLGVSYAIARELVLDPAGDRLWLALRALDLGRAPIAQIGYGLCEADPRRDLEEFADALDGIVAIAADSARDAIARLRLPSDYRAALIALDRDGECA